MRSGRVAEISSASGGSSCEHAIENRIPRRRVSTHDYRRVKPPSDSARPPSRIVSLAPKNTEELFAIGAGSQVVGVTSYCNFPIEARQREQVGGFSSKSISLEKVVALHPDLVVSAGDIHTPIIAELDRLEHPVMALAAETVDELYVELKSLATLVGRETDAKVDRGNAEPS